MRCFRLSTGGKEMYWLFNISHNVSVPSWLHVNNKEAQIFIQKRKKNDNEVSNLYEHPFGCQTSFSAEVVRHSYTQLHCIVDCIGLQRNIHYNRYGTEINQKQNTMACKYHELM